MRMLIIPAAVAAALTVAACGETTIDSGKGEKLITAEIEKVAGVTGVKVSCPDDIKAKKDAIFYCDATGADATKARVKVRQKDSDGNVRFDAALLHTGEAEAALKPRIEGTAKGVKVDCPDLIVPRTGASVMCKATAADGSSLNIKLTFTNNTGKFDFEVVQ